MNIGFLDLETGGVSITKNGNTFYGAQLNVWLQKEKWIRELCNSKNLFQKWKIRRSVNKIRIV